LLVISAVIVPPAIVNVALVGGEEGALFSVAVRVYVPVVEVLSVAVTVKYGCNCNVSGLPLMRYHAGFAAARMAVVSVVANEATLHEEGGLGHGLVADRWTPFGWMTPVDVS
jgi:hypothetical protein